MKSISDKNIEEWMFDYTEGNLSATQQKQLISFIEQNPHYAEELKIWSMAFIKAPLSEVGFDKFSLKQSIFRRHFKTWGIRITCILTATLLYLWYSYPKVNTAVVKANKNSVVKKPHRTIYNARTYASVKSTLPKKTDTFRIKKKTSAPIEHAPSFKVHAENESPAEALLPVLNTDTGSALKRDTIPESLEDSLSNKPEEHIAGAENTKEAKHRSLSKKELKDIERMKMKALQRRREAEFMKGNKPYVVPFNNGF